MQAYAGSNPALSTIFAELGRLRGAAKFRLGVGTMKRIPMGQEARLKAAEKKRKLARAGKAAVIAMATVTAALWSYVFLQG